MRPHAEQWELLQHNGARLHTSVPVMIETFTFLDRNANRDTALAWKLAVDKTRAVVLPCERRDENQGRGSLLFRNPDAAIELP